MNYEMLFEMTFLFALKMNVAVFLVNILKCIGIRFLFALLLFVHDFVIIDSTFKAF